MELVYLYIRSFRNLKNLEINLSANHFLYISRDKELKIEKDRYQHIEDFWGSSILNLSAIVGENGVGKSTILSAILLLVNNYSVLKQQVYKEDINLLGVIKYNNSFFVLEMGKTDLSWSSDFKKVKKNSDYRFLINTIFYSNNIDYFGKLRLGAHADISTLNLINHSFEYSGENRIDVSFYDFVEVSKKKYRNAEMIKQINFISKFKDHSPIGLPDKISITLNDIYNLIDELEIKSEKLDNNSNTRIVLEAIKFVSRVTSDNFVNSENGLDIKIDFLKSLFSTLIMDVIQDPSYNMPFNDLLYTSSNNFIVQNTKRKFTNIEDFVIALGSYLNSLEYKNADFTDLGNWSLNFADFIRENSISYSDNNIYFEFLVTKQSLSSLIELFDAFSFNVRFGTFFTVDWAGMSSGEIAFLSLFSRLLSIKEHITADKTQLLILDEPEIGFHPNWQRELIKKIVEVIPLIFPHRNFQIIITSHSPIILSDIPKNHIVFLKNIDGIAKVADLSDKNQTFGANIHTLYSDSFFMKDGTIGEYSRGKINDVIELLLGSEEKLMEKRLLVWQIIQTIGEPIVKSKLIQLYNEKLGNHYHGLLTRIENIERKIK